MSVWQRSALGIAAPGDAYWVADTQLYLGMDMRPYAAQAWAARL
jgi:hypothetical protein